ncbi:MAG: phosphoribosyltransferase [Trueperaceae bacterium]|nr:MAG: phosphoribosyltransferase [Trueperaceae bacterium]
MWMFEDRREAGKKLAMALSGYAGRNDVVVLALPRGGVPVAFEVACSLRAPLDLLLVRKLGVPRHRELAMGAIASGGVRVMNDEIVNTLSISREAIDEVARAETVELERRERAYRGDRDRVDIADQTVIVIDDGIATGATMLAAVSALKKLKPARVVVAVPTAAADSCIKLRRTADEVISLANPEPYIAVGRWYRLFPQTSDVEVKDLLDKAAERHQPTP